MYCPQCKAEYREGFTRCADCDVELVKNYVEAGRHPLAKKVAVGDDYGALLWRGRDPHFYMGLLWSLWNKNVACYGVPEHPLIPGATQVMSQILRHWEFEPSAGFGIGKNPLLDYWAVRATENGW